MKKKIWIVAVILLAVNLAAGVFIWYAWSKTYSNLTIEAGTEITAQAFIKGNVKSISFAEDSPVVDTSVPGRYVLKVTADGFTRNCVLNVVDTIAPEAEPVSVYMSVGETYEAEDFVTNITDATVVTASFENRPDFGGYGHQEVEVILTDAGGNSAKVTADLYVLKVNLIENYVWDAADGLPHADWFLTKEGEISYDGIALNSVDFTLAGVYPVGLKVDGISCQVNLEVTDTKAPVFTVKETQGYLNHPMEAAEFVDVVEDDTQVTYDYKEEPDWTAETAQEVVVVATDSAGNTAEMPSVLTLIPDVEAPVIIGAGNISVCLGENVSYRTGVSAYDECDGDVTIQIDNSAVNLTEIGTYKVIYSATDSSGNVATREVKLTVMPEQNENITLDMMYAEADKIIAEIITDDMTDYQKAEAIYNWTRWKIGFISDSQKEDWVKSAYDGFIYRKGDCYTYACVAKALLTRAGIPNVDIWRNSTTSSHYWNLVDTGEGWYHFDATPRADKTIVFMWSETQLVSDEAVRRSHVYDHSLFPTVNAN